MAKKGAKRKCKRPQDVKVAASPAERLTKPVRLDLKPSDHDRLDRQASRRGLTMASYARMVLLEKLDEEEGE